jgi:DNA-binding transcriptional MocR family regulator
VRRTACPYSTEDELFGHSLMPAFLRCERQLRTSHTGTFSKSIAPVLRCRHAVADWR